MRIGDIVAAALVGLVAIAGITFWLGRPRMTEVPPTVEMSRAAARLADAQRVRWVQARAFADSAALAPVDLGDGVMLRMLHADSVSYAATLVGPTREPGAHWCTMVGRGPAADGQHRFHLSCHLLGGSATRATAVMVRP